MRPVGRTTASSFENDSVTTRILIAGFKHETHSFSHLATTLDDYRARALLHGEEMNALRGTATEIAGFLDACDENG